MQINFNSSRVASAALRGLDPGETSVQLQARPANREHVNGADDLRALVRATAFAWQVENAVWLTVAAAAAGVLLLSFKLSG